jgi:serine protease inhibitor
LVNGIYFKGLWKDQFKPEHTRKSPFYLNDTEKVDVDMMYKEAKFPYAELQDLDAHAIALPYKVRQ